MGPSTGSAGGRQKQGLKAQHLDGEVEEGFNVFLNLLNFEKDILEWKVIINGNGFENGLKIFLGVQDHEQCGAAFYCTTRGFTPHMEIAYDHSHLVRLRLPMPDCHPQVVLPLSFPTALVSLAATLQWGAVGDYRCWPGTDTLLPACPRCVHHSAPSGPAWPVATDERIPRLQGCPGTRWAISRRPGITRIRCEHRRGRSR
ncbi:hypothetical protein NDU88_000263 [Pleurodeles waltl]|uniref:Uncharacterized protein n=1 Tax=Pleurodeles waltl TaxID=8319 RepID=A0AAV7L811_PLEWA|nr:hypothetical protein NDU88_000263 [Pleurodeles waltl]